MKIWKFWKLLRSELYFNFTIYMIDSLYTSKFSGTRNCITLCKSKFEDWHFTFIG